MSGLGLTATLRLQGAWPPRGRCCGAGARAGVAVSTLCAGVGGCPSVLLWGWARGHVLLKELLLLLPSRGFLLE